MLPISLIILAVMALALHLLFGYLLPKPVEQPYRSLLAGAICVLILIIWFVLPVRIGP